MSLGLLIGVMGGTMLLLRAPVPAEARSDAAQEGADLFATRGCAHCHGEAGLGGAIGPDLSRVGQRRTAAEMARQIQQGGHGMPPYGDQLTHPEVAALVAYLRSNRMRSKGQ